MGIRSRKDGELFFLDYKPVSEENCTASPLDNSNSTWTEAGKIVSVSRHTSYSNILCIIWENEWEAWKNMEKWICLKKVWIFQEVQFVTNYNRINAQLRGSQTTSREHCRDMRKAVRFFALAWRTCLENSHLIINMWGPFIFYLKRSKQIFSERSFFRHNWYAAHTDLFCVFSCL